MIEKIYPNISSFDKHEGGDNTKSLLEYGAVCEVYENEKLTLKFPVKLKDSSSWENNENQPCSYCIVNKDDQLEGLTMEGQEEGIIASFYFKEPLLKLTTPDPKTDSDTQNEIIAHLTDNGLILKVNEQQIGETNKDIKTKHYYL